MRTRRALTGAVELALAFTALGVWWRFDSDIRRARSRVAHGSQLVTTRCGPIEYQEAGSRIPLLAIQRSGGGYDQGMAFAAALALVFNSSDLMVAAALTDHGLIWVPDTLLTVG